MSLRGPDRSDVDDSQVMCPACLEPHESVRFHGTLIIGCPQVREGDYVPMEWAPPLVAQGTLRGVLVPASLPPCEWDD